MSKKWTRNGSVVALSLTVIVLCCSHARAAKPGGGGNPPAVLLNPAIAFVTTQSDTRQDVVVAAANLSSEIALTQAIQGKSKGLYTHLFWSPAWSTSGSNVAFWAQDKRNGATKLYVVNADGTQVALVRDFMSRPSIHQPGNSPLNWSPSGMELVYDTIVHSLVAIDVSTGDIRVLLDAFDNGEPIEQPALSPDLDDSPGYQGLVATRGLDGSVDAEGTPQYDIFIAPIFGDEFGRLAPIDPGLMTNITNSAGTNEFHPSWSPEGDTLACFHDDGTDEWLAVIDMSTGLLLPIYPDYATEVNAEDRAAWTSDARHLVYRTDFSGIDRYDLSIIAADGSAGPVNFTNTPRRRERAPVWNPQWNASGPGAF